MKQHDINSSKFLKENLKEKSTTNMDNEYQRDGYDTSIEYTNYNRELNDSEIKANYKLILEVKKKIN
jgi:hypothetical protein